MSVQVYLFVFGVFVIVQARRISDVCIFKVKTQRVLLTNFKFVIWQVDTMLLESNVTQLASFAIQRGMSNRLALKIQI